MHTLISFFSILLATGVNSAQAADPAKPYYPAAEYCYVSVTEANGAFNRTEIRFDLLSSAAKFDKTVVINQDVSVSIRATWQAYELAFYVLPETNTPLVSGNYLRTGVLLDFLTNGFTVTIKDREYVVACATENFL